MTNANFCIWIVRRVALRPPQHLQKKAMLAWRPRRDKLSNAILPLNGAMQPVPVFVVKLDATRATVAFFVPNAQLLIERMVTVAKNAPKI